MAQTGIDDGPALSAWVIDWAWRRDAVLALHERGWSYRMIAAQVGCSHEKARHLVASGYSQAAPK